MQLKTNALSGAGLLAGLAMALIPQPMSAQETTLHVFTGGGDGTQPAAALTLGPGGVLYGTTSHGGLNQCFSGCGTIFSLTPPATPGGDWTDSVLYRLASADNGYAPSSPLLIGNGGVLYGEARGAAGVVFSLTPPAAPGGLWTYAPIYDTPGFPIGGLVMDSAGVLYGTSSNDGASLSGTIFTLTPPALPGGPWTYTVLYEFGPPPDAGSPQGGVSIGSGGVLYGTALLGGASGFGAVFALAPPAAPGGAWQETVLYNFSGGPDGGDPLCRLAISTNGTLYGATEQGGSGTPGNGTVFSLTPPASPGSPWKERVLHKFGGGNGDGKAPAAGVVLGSGGVLYGAAPRGGADNWGAIFSVTPPATKGGSWTETVLYSFTGAHDGATPEGITIDQNGVLYGATDRGGLATGKAGDGTVFSLVP